MSDSTHSWLRGLWGKGSADHPWSVQGLAPCWEDTTCSHPSLSLLIIVGSSSSFLSLAPKNRKVRQGSRRLPVRGLTGTGCPSKSELIFLRFSSSASGRKPASAQTAYKMGAAWPCGGGEDAQRGGHGAEPLGSFPLRMGRVPGLIPTAHGAWGLAEQANQDIHFR